MTTRFRPVLARFLAACLALHASAACAETPTPEPFMRGADISALKTLEDDGAVYRHPDGTPGDALHVMTEQGLNWYRLRLFVDPDGVGVVNNDLAYTTALAKRVKAAGGAFLLDFHYSDTWADPGKQYKPKAWEDLSFEALAAQVEAYTREVVEHLDAAGAAPDMVQIGNEITAGMLWPDGRLWVEGEDQDAAFDRLAILLKAGMQGVRTASIDAPTPKLMVHIARGDRWHESEFFFTKLAERDLDFDIIGYSYYPRFHGTVEELRDNFHRTAEAFQKPIVLVEFGFAYTGGEFEPNHEAFEYPVTIRGQSAFTRDVVRVVRETPNGLGKGVFWWHAAATPTDSGLAWEGGRLGLFDENGRALPAMTTMGRN
ncbi:MAG: glycosyl hydrolase 53 family protein [Planctomycetota bacterium]